MSSPTLARRACGVLLHPSSLPGRHGIGDLGAGARQFADWLVAAGQSWWQMLPVEAPGGGGQSPYFALTAFGGNPLLISLEDLVDDGLLDAGEIPAPADFPGERAQFGDALARKLPALRRAFARFGTTTQSALRHDFDTFRSTNVGWLPEFSLFCAIKEQQGGKPWWDWEAALRSRESHAIATARTHLEADIAFHEFVQFVFDRQWRRLHEHCRARGLGLIGDVPIYLAHDSADVWSNAELFHLDAQGRRTVQAGVPPDYFSEDGQLWGNPLYRWDRLRERGFDWWVARIKSKFQRFEVVRLDHFIGFHRCWEVAADATHARNGRWVMIPGQELFDTLQRVLGPIEVIAEDLGLLIPEVEQLRDRQGFPGMKVLQFVFGGGLDEDRNRPHRFTRPVVVYTGTHDNDTTVGWYRTTTGPATPAAEERRLATRYAGSDGREIHWDFIRMAYQSVANLAIVPLQDVLGLGSDARMNAPGTRDGNWEWRFAEGALTAPLSDRLCELARLYGRVPAELRRETTR